MDTAVVLLFGLFKFGKIGGTLVTVLISLAIYAGVFGWRYAAGFILLLLVHEMGHFLAARQRGLSVSARSCLAAWSGSRCVASATAQGGSSAY
jgi:hypothetical protein